MYAATLLNPINIIRLFPPCFRVAFNFLVLPDRLHRWSMVFVSGMILLLVAGFVSFAYAEKYHLVNNFFYGKLQFSFVDDGYPEIFGYVLELFACAIFATFAWMHEKKQWYAFAAILLVTFLDDAFQSHETIGKSFTAWFGVSPVQGDLIGFASTGLICAVFWFAGVVKIRSEGDLKPYLVFTGYYALLILFGVVVDAVHGHFGEHGFQTVFTLLEDGGELVTTSIIALSALGMWLRQRHTATGKLEEFTALQ